MSLIERLRRWSPVISNGYDIPAAAQSMDEAADALERLAEYAEHGLREDGKPCSSEWHRSSLGVCDCGLEELLKEIGVE